MPIIPTYQDHVTPMGSIQAQATPQDFGSSIGAGMQQLGGGIQSVAEGVQDYEVRKNTTAAHVLVAQGEDQWAKAIQERARTAKPGDDSFAQSVQTDMNDWFTKAGANIQTGAAGRAYQSLVADAQDRLYKQAIGVQGELAATEATNQFHQIRTSFSNLSEMDGGWKSFKDYKDQIHKTFNDPNTIFGKIPSAKRDELEYTTVQNAAQGAFRSFTREHPQAAMAWLAPDLAAAYAKVAVASVPGGGKLNVSPATMDRAAEIVPAATEAGVPANVAMAVMDQHTPGTPVAPVLPDLATLLTKYKGNLPAVLAAFHSGTGVVDNAQAIFDQNWRMGVPPEASAFAETTMDKAGLTPAPAPVSGQATAPGKPVFPGNQDEPVPADLSKLPFAAYVPRRDVEAILHESMMMQNQMRTKTLQDQAMQQQALDRQRESAMSDIFGRIANSHLGQLPTVDEITGTRDNPSVLTAGQQAWLLDRRSEKASGGGVMKSDPGTFNSLFKSMVAGTLTTDALNTAVSRNQLAAHDWKFLMEENTLQRDGTTTPFGRMKYSALQEAEDTFTKYNPFLAPQARYLLTWDLHDKEQEYRDAKKNPMDLLNPNKLADFMFSPEKIQSYLTRAAAGAKPGANLPDFEHAEVGKPFRDPNGKIRTKVASAVPAPAPGGANPTKLFHFDTPTPPEPDTRTADEKFNDRIKKLNAEKD